MYNHLTIHDFRGIKRKSTVPLSALTVLVGPNNSGKTTVLESLYLASSALRLDALTRILTHRGPAVRETAEAALRIAKTAVVASTISGDTHAVNVEEAQEPDALLRLVWSLNNQQRAYAEIDGSINIRQWDKPSDIAKAKAPIWIEADRVANNIDTLETMVSRADIAGELKHLIDLVQPLLPGLKDLRLMTPYNRTTLFAVDSTGRWPVALAGDGFKRLLMMGASIASSDTKTVFLEEPETFQHPASLRQVASLLWSAIGQGKQIVISTHSLEFLDAQFLNANQEDLKKASVVRLALNNGKLKAICVPGLEVKTLRDEINEDLRR